VYHAELAPGDDPRPRERGQAAGKQAQHRIHNRPELLPPGRRARLGDRCVEGRPQNPQEKGSDHCRDVSGVGGGQDGVVQAGALEGWNGERSIRMEGMKEKGAGFGDRGAERRPQNPQVDGTELLP
jgi:hypothetical protein